MFPNLNQAKAAQYILDCYIIPNPTGPRNFSFDLAPLKFLVAQVDNEKFNALSSEEMVEIMETLDRGKVENKTSLRHIYKGKDYPVVDVFNSPFSQNESENWNKEVNGYTTLDRLLENSAAGLGNLLYKKAFGRLEAQANNNEEERKRQESFTPEEKRRVRNYLATLIVLGDCFNGNEKKPRIPVLAQIAVCSQQLEGVENELTPELIYKLVTDNVAENKNCIYENFKEKYPDQWGTILESISMPIPESGPLLQWLSDNKAYEKLAESDYRDIPEIPAYLIPKLNNVEQQADNKEEAENDDNIINIDNINNKPENVNIINVENEPQPQVEQNTDLDVYGFGTSEENRRTILTHLLGKDGELSVANRPFDPMNREDVLRLFRRNDKGEYEPAFPDAADPKKFKGLTEQQTVEVFTPEKGFLYYGAGSNSPIVFTENGTNTWQNSRWNPTWNPKTKKPGSRNVAPAFANNQNPRLGMSKEALEQEGKRKELDVTLKELKRAETVNRFLFGSKLDHVGPDTYKTYDEIWVSNIIAKGGKEYPVPAGKALPEDDVVALTILNLADPDVTGQVYDGLRNPLKDKRFITINHLDMNLDTYLNRNNTNKAEVFIDPIVYARERTSLILTKYYEADENASGRYDRMGAALAKGLPVLMGTLTFANESFTPAMITRFSQLQKVQNLIEKHPQLLEAAKRKAEELGTLDAFERSLRQCRTLSKMCDFTKRSAENELRLARHQAGELYDDKGEKIELSAEEVKMLQIESAKRDLLPEMLIEYSDQQTIGIYAEFAGKIAEQTTEFRKNGTCEFTQYIIPEEKRGPIENPTFERLFQMVPTIEIEGQKKEVAPVLTLILEHENGMAVFDDILRNAQNPRDKKEITKALLDNKLIPAGNDSDPSFDYDSAIRSYVARNLNINNINNINNVNNVNNVENIIEVNKPIEQSRQVIVPEEPQPQVEVQQNTDLDVYGVETTSEENRKTILTRLLGKDSDLGIVNRPFDPMNREDVLRLFRRNNKGEYEPAFPDAADPRFKGLTEQQTVEVFTPENGFLYYDAGYQSGPLVFTENGRIGWGGSHWNPKFGQPDALSAVPVFANNQNPRLGMSKEALEQEKERKNLDLMLKELKRAETVNRFLFGSKLDHVGPDTYKTYDEIWVSNIIAKGGKEYPVPAGKALPEDDVIALTILNLADPDVTGQVYDGLMSPLKDDRFITNRHLDMNLDTYLNRQSTNKSSTFIDPIVYARDRTNSILTKYYEANENASDRYDRMGAALAKGLPMLTGILVLPPEPLGGSMLTRYSQMQKVQNLIKNHPQILKAAERKAEELGTLDAFKRSLRQCQTLSKMYDFGKNAAENALRLARYQAGELYDTDGQKIDLQPEEAKTLQRETEKRNVLTKMLNEHSSRQTMALSVEIVPHNVEETRRYKKEGACEYTRYTIPEEKRMAIEHLFQTNSVIALEAQKKEVAPVLTLILEHESGMAVFDDILRRAKDPQDDKEITRALIDNNLIPADNNGDPSFDYDGAISAYVARNLNINNINNVNNVGNNEPRQVENIIEVNKPIEQSRQVIVPEEPQPEKAQSTVEKQIETLQGCADFLQKTQEVIWGRGSKQFSDLQRKVNECLRYMKEQKASKPNYAGAKESETKEMLAGLGKYARTYLRTKQDADGNKKSLNTMGEVRYWAASKVLEMAQYFEPKQVVMPKDYAAGKNMLEKYCTQMKNTEDMLEGKPSLEQSKFDDLYKAVKGLNEVENKNPAMKLKREVREKAVNRIEKLAERYIDAEKIMAEKAGKEPTAESKIRIDIAEKLRGFAKGYKNVLPNAAQASKGKTESKGLDNSNLIK